MKEFVHYVRADLRRLLAGYVFYLSIPGVTAALFFSLETEGFVNGNVLDTYDFAINMSGVMITFIFCALPFAAAFSEDLEHKYLRCELIRGRLKSYVAAKTAVICLSSVLVMLGGSLLFVLLCRTQLPWYMDPELGGNYEAMTQGAYGVFLRTGHYLVYCALQAFHMGMLASVLSMLAALCSVFLSNRTLVFALPAVLFRVLASVNIAGCNVYVFFGYVDMLRNDLGDLLFVIALAGVFVFLFSRGIFAGLKRKL